MKRVSGLIVGLITHWSSLSYSEQIYVVWNTAFDVFLVAFLGLMIWVGLTTDPNAFLIWVPLLAFAVFWRLRQLPKRWGI